MIFELVHINLKGKFVFRVNKGFFSILKKNEMIKKKKKKSLTGSPWSPWAPDGPPGPEAPGAPGDP